MTEKCWYYREKYNLIDKREKGVTLISLTIYVVVMVLVIALIAVITSFFYNNVMNIDKEAVELAELNKLNLYMIEETEKEGNSIETISSDGKKITFNNGNAYTIQDNGIYQNSIRICKNVNTKATEFGKTKEKGKEILKVYYETETGIGRSLEYVVKDNNVYIAWEDELNYTEGSNNTSGGQTTIVPIPDGYVASQVEGENTKEDGLVIYEGTDPVTAENHATAMSSRNQYVWIPVDDINDMVMCSSNSGDSVCDLIYNEEANTLTCQTHPDTATNLVGRLYTSSLLDTGNNIYSYTMDFMKRDQTYNASSYREPDTVDSDASNGLTLSQLKSDFTVMAKSVAKNGGFYISRYEIGEGGSSKKSQPVLTAATTGGGSGETAYLGANMWYGLYNTIRNISANKQMIWGCQYEQVIKFVGEQAQVGHSDRNLTTTHALSGQNELDCMKNIYDLEGNHYEWTAEAVSARSRASRGCYYIISLDDFYPASDRYSIYPTYSSYYFSARSTLYIGLEEEQIQEPISKPQSYVGYYADVDGDKQPDGIIYADLADTEHTSGTWDGDNWSSYEYTPATEGLKQYEVCNESYTGFGNQWTKPVLTAVEGSEGADRFYVMALEDFNDANGPSYCWYYDAIEELDNLLETETVNDFGQGKRNTKDMIVNWNRSIYGAQNADGRYKDMWGVIQTEISNISNPIWFVPSKSEWAAFGDFAYTKMGVDRDNYANYGLSDKYWSSTQCTSMEAYSADFYYTCISCEWVDDHECYVRLSATF